MRHSRTRPLTSTSERQAVMTTAARAAVGRLVVMPGTKTSMTAMAMAPTTPVSWVRAPADSATGVREALLLMGKPCTKPVAMLAAPSATSSWSGSARVPARPARMRDRTLVSAIDTSAMAAAPVTMVVRLPRSNMGNVGRGRPCGSGPTVATLQVAAAPVMATTMVAPTTATSTPGILGSQRLKPTMTTMQATPMARSAGLVSPSATPWTKACVSATSPSASIEKPKSFGSCPTRTVSAMPSR